MVKYKSVIPAILSTALFFAGGYYLGRRIGTDIFTQAETIIYDSKHIDLDNKKQSD